MRHVLKSRARRTRDLTKDFEDGEEATDRVFAEMEHCIEEDQAIPDKLMRKFQFAQYKDSKRRRGENRITRNLLVEHIISCDVKNLVQVIVLFVIMFFVVGYMGEDAITNWMEFLT